MIGSSFNTAFVPTPGKHLSHLSASAPSTAPSRPLDGPTWSNNTVPPQISYAGRVLSFEALGQNEVHLAITSGNLDQLAEIFECEPRVDLYGETDSSGRPALHLCASTGHFDCLAFILSKGVSPNRPDEVRYRSHSVLSGQALFHMHTLQCGWMPLHDAVSVDCALELLRCGADIEARTPAVS